MSDAGRGVGILAVRDFSTSIAGHGPEVVRWVGVVDGLAGRADAGDRADVRVLAGDAVPVAVQVICLADPRASWPGT